MVAKIDRDSLLSSLEELQRNLLDAGMLRMKASLYSEPAAREALGDSEYRRLTAKLDERALLSQLDAVALFLLQILDLASVGEGEGDLLGSVADVMNSFGKFPHLFGLCMILESGGDACSESDVAERFIQCLSLRLH